MINYVVARKNNKIKKGEMGRIAAKKALNEVEKRVITNLKSKN